MNSFQKLGICILIVITVLYVYFSFFNNNMDNFDFSIFNKKPHETEFKPSQANDNEPSETITKTETKNIKIFILDKTGNIRSVYRTCNTNSEKSCFEYSIKELLAAPSKWEKSKGFMSEIPQGTKLLSVRESQNSIMIDLSSDFETGGGAESTYIRILQIIKTANANTSIPVYLYINGKQANVIGGEGIMVKQPLNNKSLD